MSKHSRDPHPVDYVINKYRQYSDAEHSNSWNNAVHRGCDLLEDWLEGEFFDEYTEWTADHLEEYGTWLQRNYDFSDRYIRNHLTVARQVLRRANTMHHWDVVLEESNPTSIYNTDLSLSRTNRMEDERDENIVYVTPDMHKKVLDVCEIQRDRVLLRCLWQLGARPSEISNIKLSDVDRDRKEVKLVTKKQDDTKTRYVPYKSSLEFELTEWIDSGKRQSYGPIKWENEHEVSEEGYLINTQRSKKMSADQIQKRVRELCERANVGGVEYTREQLHPQGQTGKMDVTKRKYRSISSKSWRHGFAMRAMDANMPIPYISYLLGHESTEITTEMYLHVNRNEAYNAYRQYL